MMSPYGERALEDCQSQGRALLKFISPNEAGVTGSHQRGFYLPLNAWELYTPHPPTQQENSKHSIHIQWQDGNSTESVVTWYGRGTRYEYRLTNFGRGFPFLNPDSVGNLFVLIPFSMTEFRAYVLDLEEDIDLLQSSLGVNVLGSWAIYDSIAPYTEPEDEEECVMQLFREFAESVNAFPTGADFSKNTQDILAECIAEFADKNPDEKVMRLYDAEYKLFQLVERRICEPDVTRLFQNLDDFIKIANSITNRRRARAGRSLENHFASVFAQANIPFQPQPPIDGSPDFIIPNAESYFDPSYPIERLFVIGVKTTCKDRWRQVLNEGRRVHHKHLATIQQGISLSQLTEMARADVSLVVPNEFHGSYPSGSPMRIMTVGEFIQTVKDTLTDV